MKKVFLLWRCDLHHTQDSKRLLYVGSKKTTKRQIVDIATDYSKNSDEGVIVGDDIFILYNHNQTQGRMENYIIEVVEQDKLLETVIK